MCFQPKVVGVPTSVQVLILLIPNGANMGKMIFRLI